MNGSGVGEAKTIAIIGGGASGLAAAVAAGEAVRDAEGAARIVVYEAFDRVGRSILATGNGRCNFSNARPGEGDYRNAAFVRRVLLEFEGQAHGHVPSQAKTSTAYPNGVLGFFSDHGLMWREEGEGRLYPLGEQGRVRARLPASGLHCSRAWKSAWNARSRPWSRRAPRARRSRCAWPTGASSGPTRSSWPWAVQSRAGFCPRAFPSASRSRRWARWPPSRAGRAASTISACAGRWNCGAPIAAGWTPPEERGRHGYPMGTHEGERLASREVGEVMFRKYGVSGIAAFNLSRLAEPGDVLAVDFVPWVRLCDMEAFLNRRRKMLRASLGHDVTWDDMLRGMVLAPVADVLLEAAALDGARPVAKGETVRMAPVLKGLRLPVTGLGDVKQCQVHRGGVSVRAVDDRTCEVRRVPGLYVVGEALDVDAACGGFNLHWAWASGLLAGWSAAERLRA